MPFPAISGKNFVTQCDSGSGLNDDGVHALLSRLRPLVKCSRAVGPCGAEAMTLSASIKQASIFFVASLLVVDVTKSFIFCLFNEGSAFTFRWTPSAISKVFFVACRFQIPGISSRGETTTAHTLNNSPRFPLRMAAPMMATERKTIAQTPSAAASWVPFPRLLRRV